MHLQRALNAPHPFLINAALKDCLPLSSPCVGRLVSHYRPLNQVLRWHCFFLNCEKTKGAYEKKKKNAFISMNLFVKRNGASERCEGGKGRDKDQPGKKSLLLRQLNSCCVSGKLLIYGSKTPASYSRGKWAADRSLVEIKKLIPSELLWYDTIQFNKAVKCALIWSTGNLCKAEAFLSVAGTPKALRRIHWFIDWFMITCK